MSQPETVVVRIPINGNDPTGMFVEYKVTPKNLAYIMLDIINNSSPEFLSSIDESLEEILDVIDEVLDPPKETTEERMNKFFDKLVLNK
jgi:hypothetical protein